MLAHILLLVQAYRTQCRPCGPMDKASAYGIPVYSGRFSVRARARSSLQSENQRGGLPIFVPPHVCMRGSLPAFSSCHPATPQTQSWWTSAWPSASRFEPGQGHHRKQKSKEEGHLHIPFCSAPCLHARLPLCGGASRFEPGQDYHHKQKSKEEGTCAHARLPARLSLTLSTPSSHTANAGLVDKRMAQCGGAPCRHVVLKLPFCYNPIRQELKLAGVPVRMSCFAGNWSGYKQPCTNITPNTGITANPCCGQAFLTTVAGLLGCSCGTWWFTIILDLLYNRLCICKHKWSCYTLGA